MYCLITSRLGQCACKMMFEDEDSSNHKGSNMECVRAFGSGNLVARARIFGRVPVGDLIPPPLTSEVAHPMWPVIDERYILKHEPLREHQL